MWGAKPSTFGNSRCWGRRGRPNPQIDDFRPIQKPCKTKPKCRASDYLVAGPESVGFPGRLEPPPGLWHDMPDLVLVTRVTGNVESRASQGFGNNRSNPGTRTCPTGSPDRHRTENRCCLSWPAVPSLCTSQTTPQIKKAIGVCDKILTRF